ncbi:SH3 domain-containing protein [Streptomyces sp. IB2014 016-6]|uniref:SH3 domain-containing protein n=1 Tax=Streptomyces sp. IB2014 016-6 TaxID=2517818 RepID=UPI0011C7B347|nr:SH3 domain-containing protein [Streptomyces sp. IB2014 016-6]TXL90925.1 SH3 domain-containing protein [Streptomyces sp. IB2014 016-6]
MSQRSLRSSTPRLRGSFGPYVAALAIAAAALTATPALAAVPTPPPVGFNGHADADAGRLGNVAPEAEVSTRGSGEYKGRVTARTGLLLRDRPTRGGRVIGSAAYGSIVHILCKTRGDEVNGNDRWYLLTDGNWAWGSAAYIENIGKAPRWC